MLSRAYVYDVIERAIKTGAQTASGVVVVGLSIGAVDWAELASITGVAVLASLLSSVASRGLGGDTNTASVLSGSGEARGRHAAP
jgi:hypothetical protein